MKLNDKRGVVECIRATCELKASNLPHGRSKHNQILIEGILWGHGTTRESESEFEFEFESESEPSIDAIGGISFLSCFLRIVTLCYVHTHTHTHNIRVYYAHNPDKDRVQM